MNTINLFCLAYDNIMILDIVITVLDIKHIIIHVYELLMFAVRSSPLPTKEYSHLICSYHNYQH